MKIGDLIALNRDVSTTTYLSELNKPEGFMGVVIGFTREDNALTQWYNEIYISVPTENGRVIRLLLTNSEIENNFMVIS